MYAVLIRYCYSYCRCYLTLVLVFSFCLSSSYHCRYNLFFLLYLLGLLLYFISCMQPTNQQSTVSCWLLRLKAFQLISHLPHFRRFSFFLLFTWRSYITRVHIYMKLSIFKDTFFLRIIKRDRFLMNCWK